MIRRSTGITTLPISTSASCGRSIRRPTKPCSTEYAPWYVVPSDHRWYSRLAVGELLINALERLDLSYPPPDFDVEAENKRLTEAYLVMAPSGPLGSLPRPIG
jgi:hypothetical protein